MQGPHRRRLIPAAICVSSYYFMCVLILLCVYADTGRASTPTYSSCLTARRSTTIYYIKTKFKKKTPPTYSCCLTARRCTTIYVSSYCYKCVRILLYVSSYYYICVLILLCVFIPICVSSCYHTCVLIPLYKCPHTARYGSSQYQRTTYVSSYTIYVS